ncbi:hypothetical protein Q5X48_14860 [Acinetobacter baumannii]|nr:hypothetical protein [Acinetobacter baumannii]
MEKQTAFKILSIKNRFNPNATKILEQKDFETIAESVEGFNNFPTSLLPTIIDWEKNEILLSDIDSLDSLNKFPFFYQWQRNKINNLYVLPFEFLQKSSLVNNNVSPIFVFSIGRCGSTLLVNLCESLGIKTISEPDFLANISERIGSNHSEETISEILKWNTNLFSPFFGTSPLIKLRGSSIKDIEIFSKIFPNSKYIFMLREPMAWAKSNIKAFNDDPISLAYYLKEGIEAYKKLFNLNLNLSLIWYEDLVDKPEEILCSLFGEKNFPVNYRSLIKDVMSKDSQEGSTISQSELAKRNINHNFLEEFKRSWIEIYPEDLIKEFNLNKLKID